MSSERWNVTFLESMRKIGDPKADAVITQIVDEHEIRAVNEMIARTSTRAAPWTLVEANDKYYARIKVMKELCERLKGALR